MHLFFHLTIKNNIILNNQNMLLVLKKMKVGDLVIQIMQLLLLRIVVKIIVILLEMDLMIFKINMN